MARIFRLNDVKTDIEFQKENQKIWDLANSPQFKYLRRNAFNVLQSPSPNPQVPVNEQFIEAKQGINKFLLNFNSQQFSTSPVMDMKLNNTASSCLFTTLERNIQREGPEEDVLPNEALFGLDMKKNIINNNEQNQENLKSKLNKSENSRKDLNQQQQSEKKLDIKEKERQYQTHEGALLVIGGQFGLVEFVVIPLAALMIDIPPMKYTSAFDVLKIGMQTKEQKLQNSIHEMFTFPPESQFMDLGRSPVQLTENGKYIFVKGERSYIIRFESCYGKTIWSSIFSEGGIRCLAPIGSMLNEKKLKFQFRKSLGLAMKIILRYLSEQLLNNRG
ncbi:MAG: hypothetical protein EZS28_006063 [Streblomastix strix]|uniref:Uncharacterized protein n=1 Tax=Streblomastix strix TaxID=222440 RepID=A0A5J4WW11_9EUKA|nr:MAG: hypothetical protein EZS28_006063 [Streblomastix strix]